MKLGFNAFKKVDKVPVVVRSVGLNFEMKLSGFARERV